MPDRPVAQCPPCTRRPASLRAAASSISIRAATPIDPVGTPATVLVVQQNQLDVRSAAAPGLKAGRYLISGRQPVDIAHRQPVRDGPGGVLPEPLQSRLDPGCELTAHPQSSWMQCAPLEPSPVAREFSRQARTSGLPSARKGREAGGTVISKCLESSGRRCTSEIIPSAQGPRGACVLDV